jgi:hypothetical protein
VTGNTVTLAGLAETLTATVPTAPYGSYVIAINTSKATLGVTVAATCTVSDSATTTTATLPALSLALSLNNALQVSTPFVLTAAGV